MSIDPAFVLTVVGTGMGILIGMGALVVSLFIYSQNKMDMALQAIQTDMKDFNKKWENESREFRERWAQESKEFHGRLIAIEERRNELLFKG